MNTFGNNPSELTCPNPKCKKDLGLKYSDIINKGKAHCMKCGCEITFNHTAINNLKAAIYDSEKANEKLSAAKNHIMANADVNIKTKL